MLGQLFHDCDPRIQKTIAAMPIINAPINPLRFFCANKAMEPTVHKNATMKKIFLLSDPSLSEDIFDIFTKNFNLKK